MTSQCSEKRVSLATQLASHLEHFHNLVLTDSNFEVLAEVHADIHIMRLKVLSITDGQSFLSKTCHP